MNGGPHLLLLGGGHSQLAVLQALARERAAGWRVTLVTPHARMLYSGMLPGWMAGHYRLEQCAIDLQRLTDAAGVELRPGLAVAIDADRRRVSLADGSVIGYERLSLDIGSGIALGALEAMAQGTGDRHESQGAGGRSPPSPTLLPVRPLAGFVAGWQRIVAQAAGRPDYRLAVLGAGAGGVELAFAARHRLGCAVSLVCGEAGLLPGHASAVRRRTGKWLVRRGVALLDGPARPEGHTLLLADGSTLEAHALLAATGAQVAPWLAASGLALVEGGQVQVDACQRSVSHASVFAAGDVCQRGDGALAGSGVHAVRAGPVLAHNLLASLRDAPLRDWRPRERSLYLLSTGERHAVMSWGPFTAAGGWVWRWKDHIDRAFIARHAAVAPRGA
jgi:NADH dehydrogenase FAD-containing subunit